MPKPSNNRTRMHESVVAFADALGTKAASRVETTAEAFLLRLHNATSLVSTRLGGIARLYNIRVRWFSDSVVMSVRFDEFSQLTALLHNLAFVQAAYALSGVFLRGVVTTGAHYHSKHIDYGPALTEAVDLERSAGGNATRIVLSPRLKHNLLAFHSHISAVVADCEDDVLFLDFLDALEAVSRRELEDEIERSYREAKRGGQADVIQKFRWLASYYNWRTKPLKPLKYELKREFRKLS